MNNLKRDRSREGYSKLRDKWIATLSGSHPNAIWSQLARMVSEEVWFKTIIRLREQGGNPAYNGHLWQMFLTGYGVKQSLGIRRLTDRDPKSASLVGIVEEMKKNHHLMSRDVVVGHAGMSMDVAQLYKDMSNSIIYGEGGSGKSDPGLLQLWSDAEHAHLAFDRLRTEEAAAPQLPTDTVSPDVFDRLLSTLKGDAIGRVRHQCDKFIAHADFSNLLAASAAPSYNDIHENIRALVEVREFLRADMLNDRSGSVVPAHQGRFLNYLAESLVPLLPESDYSAAWNAVRDEVEEWGKVGCFRRFAMHPDLRSNSLR